MIRYANLFLLATALACVSNGQTNPPAAPDRADSYYNYAMGHLYAELAGAYGNRGDYVNKAIEHYRVALREDPSAGFLAEELTDLYIQAGRLRDAIGEAEEMLKQNPDNIDARRILGRIYTRMIGDPQQGKINEEMLRKSVEQYQKITDKDPKDVDAWLTLGRLYKAGNNSADAEKAYDKALALDPDNEDALTGLAIVYSDLGDTAKAIEKLKQLTDRNPNPRTLMALASSYEQMRDWKSAAMVLRRAMELQPDNPRLKRALAQDVLFSEDYDEALKLYSELSAEDPRDPQPQLRIADIYRQKRDFPKAHAALEKARQIDGNSLEVRYDEVNLLDTEGKDEEAVALLKGILEDTAKKSYSASEKANRTMLLERLGFLYRGLSKYPQAVECFRQIAALDPDSGAKAAAQVIDSLRMGKDFKQAQQEGEAALKKYPEERVIKLTYASVLADMGKTDQAAGIIRPLLSGSSAHDRDTWLALAQVYERGKRYSEETKALDEAAKLSTSKQDRATVDFMRGAMFERMKDYDRAEAEFRKVLEADPENSGALNYLGYMLADRNVRLEEAQKLISRALELEPDNGAYLDSLAWVNYRLNKLSDAENLLVRALEKIGDDPTVHDHLGDVYFKQGRTRDAILQWQTSLKEWESAAQPDLDPAEVAKVNKEAGKRARAPGSRKRRQAVERPFRPA
ncbi:MAG: tetratricopeptide repeat protein [Acidobacteria bacterium]|nr:tetratricopeptide repeat protein [Acidobacteriota bacterium]